MDRFDEALIFVRTVESGTITAAADSLSMDKSAVSRRIKSLEDRLGTQLLIRSTRKLSLTDAGRAYHARAKSLIDDWREMEDDVSGADSALAGPIRLAAPLSFGLSQLGPVLIDFQRDHPDIRLDVDFSDRMTDLTAEGFDLAVRIGQLSDSTLIARRLGPVEMILAASPDWLEKNGPVNSLADLDGAPLLSYTYANERTITATTPEGAQLSVRPQIVLKATNGEFLRDAACAGLGLTLHPDFILCDAIRDGRLVQLLPEYTFRAPSLYAVWPSTRHQPRRVRALIDALVNAYRGTPPWALESA